jgi:hypothetical protein
MNSKPETAIPGIDLSFRPASYFWPMGLETHLLSRIKGAERRAAAEGLIKAGRVDEIFDFIAKSALDDDERRAFGGIHPRFMGGEYLPDLAENEVEIARITIQSTLQDVTSVFARRGKRRIHYRVVDEYEGETLCGKAERTSTRPLTLGELEKFFNGVWSIFEILEMNFADDGYDPDGIRSFASVTSQFYPQIGELYRQRIEAWTAERHEEHGIRADDDEDQEADSLSDQSPEVRRE